MFTLYQSPPPEAIKSQILQMVVDYLSDISLIALKPSNPLYPLYQYGVGFEVHLYLEALAGSQGIPVELIVASDPDDTDTVIGFTLYQPMTGDAQACAVAYMAVREGHRRQGVARGMLGEMLARYPHAELACSVAKVPCFEALGFQVLEARGPQVMMNTRDHGSDGLRAVVEVAPIYRTLEVQQIHAYLLKQHGKKAMVEAEKKRDRHLDQLTHHARVFVEQHFNGQSRSV